jgi:hopanoid biosynthesis associated protein HpnK
LPKQVIVTADDFGLCVAVNEAVERAYREGVLTSASLMVAGEAAEDAVRRARAMPGLRVGLHLVLVEGRSVLPHSAIPDLVDCSGWFGSDQVWRGFSYFFRPAVRHQLAAEIEAQFAAFAATGFALDHADAHKHMHLHPTIGRLLIYIGRGHGLRAIRVPAEPPSVLAACGERPGIGARALFLWSRRLRRQAIAAGLTVPDQVFGLTWSGHMTAERLRRLVPRLPAGVSEIYLHPATRRDATLAALMPGYEHTAELATLLDPGLRELLRPVLSRGLPLAM